MENPSLEISRTAIPTTNNPEDRRRTAIGYPGLDHNPAQQSKRRKLSQTSDAALAKTLEPVLRLRGGGADAKRKEARKRKFGQSQLEESSLKNSEQRPGGEGTELADSGTSDHQSKKRKKHKKELATKNSNDGKAEFEVVAADAHHDADQDAENADVAKVGDAETAASKHQRFIVFIGNLPFTATTASITAHFSKVQPLSVRHRTHKTTGKSKGFAFLEFSGYDRMKTCLKLYHHSSFDDGLSPARKINVELTAGGGGAKSQERREKLQTKNEKLNEERKRRALEEEKVSRKANKKDAKVADVATEDAGDVHPSRRGRVPQG